jgi:hypothetical protein
MLEQKVEEEFLQHEFLANEMTPGPGIRPEEIPGAVRVFPPPSPSASRPGSRKGSLIMRSSSVDSSMFGQSPIASPVTVPRSAQPSPIFTRKLTNYKLASNQVSQTALKNPLNRFLLTFTHLSRQCLFQMPQKSFFLHCCNA